MGLRKEFILAVLPTVTILTVLVLFDAMSRQRFLFSSLASSAFLINLDPMHAANGVRTLLVAQLGAAAPGLVMYLLFGPGYISGSGAMLLTIIKLDMMNGRRKK